MIACKCPHCQAVMRGEDRFAGRVVACPKCKKQVQMPAAPEPNAGANPGVQSPRSTPTLQQRPAPQANAQAAMNEPAASDSGGGTSRPILIAMIALPTVAVLIGAIVIWSYEKSRRETCREEVRQVLKQNNIPEAVQKLKAYLSDENGTKASEANALLAEIELATSQNAASDTLVQMVDKDFQRFEQTKVSVPPTPLFQQQVSQ